MKVMASQKCPKCGSGRVQRGYRDAPFVLRLFGVNELLCNNCSAEFRGFALPGTVSRSRRRKIEPGRSRAAGDHQRAQRFAMRVPVKVHLLDAGGKNLHGSANFTPIFLDGYTRNLSLIGIAIILPEARFTDHDLAIRHRRARVLLNIPPRTLTVDATIIRYEQLDDEEMLTGWLVGARITRVAETERARLLKFINTFSVESSR
jgi:hypothetical protein